VCGGPEHTTRNRRGRDGRKTFVTVVYGGAAARNRTQLVRVVIFSKFRVGAGRARYTENFTTRRTDIENNSACVCVCV